MRITVLGAGALGGYFGGWLAEHGADVTFLVRPARKARLDAEGLVIDSPVGALRRPVRTVIAADVRADADLVLLTCKAYDLEAAIAAVRPALAPTGAVLPILNGLSHIDRLTTEFGADRVIGGLCKIQATLGPTGHVLHMNTWNEIIFGELDGRLTERVRALETLFPRPQTSPRATAAIVAELWKKLVHLGTVAAVTTLTRRSLDVVNRTRDGAALIELTLREVAGIAGAEGFAVPEAALAAVLEPLLAATGPYKASMLRDMEKGTQTEGAHILDDLVDRARRHGMASPVLIAAAANVQSYEATRTTA
jgi:2-dehydropantoate 2-reductase